MPETETSDSARGEQAPFLAQSERAACRRLGYWIIWIAISFLVFVLLAVLVLRAWPRTSERRSSEAKYVWVQMLPDGEGSGRLARAIVTNGDRCPKIMEGAVQADMTVRPTRVASAFPILLCEAKLAATSEAWIGSRRLPVRPSDPHDIAVLGDTGCRMTHWEIQSCRSGVKWPFGGVAVETASAIRSSGSQSIIIHVGDFHYRENPCPDDSEDCGGSPFGDNWPTWEEEFFKPAGPLLLAAPWVIMRGNHEDCGRSGAGWLFFFALPSQPYKGACLHDLPRYTLNIGETSSRNRRVLVVLDTAYEKDSFGIVKRCETYRDWLQGLESGDVEIWLALHQPLWFRDPEGGQPSTTAPRDEPCQKDVTKSALDAIRARVFPPDITARPPVRLVLSGDLHVFQFFQPSSRDVPVQIVAGTGGTKLDDLRELAPDQPKSKRTSKTFTRDTDLKPYGISGAALTVKQHGFVMMHREDSIWSVKFYDVNGKPLATCRISESSSRAQSLSTTVPDCDELQAATSGADLSRF